MSEVQEGICGPNGVRAAKFFLPFGSAEALEQEVLYLMDVLHQPYDAVMSMPCGRRKRFCEEKEHLDRYRAQRVKKKGR